MSLGIKIGDGNDIINKQEYNGGEITIRFYFNGVSVRAGDELEIGGDLANNVPLAYETIKSQDISNGYLETKINVASIVSNDKFTLEVQVADYDNTRASEKFTLVFAPVSSDDTISATEDTPFALSMSDFGTFGENLTSTDNIEVRVDSLPTNGELLYDGNIVKVGDVISANDVESGKLIFKPAENSDEDGSFKFSLAQDGEWSEQSYDLTVGVKAVADKPEVTVENVSQDSAGEGLSFTTYNNILYKDLHPDDYVRNSNILESFSDYYTGNTTVVKELAPESSLSAESMVGAKGYIYLEAGQQVTFSGTADDSTLIKLGGEVVLYTTGDAYGYVNTESAGTSSVGKGEAVSSGAFTVSQSGYYSFESYVLNSGGPGNYNIQMSVDGGTSYKAINTTNFDIYSSKSDIAEYAKNVGEENTDVKLSDIDAKLVDTDSSESLSVSIKGVPVGATLSDGTNTFIATSTNSKANVDGWDLNSLTLNAPSAGVYTLNVVATSTESNNSDTASISQALTVSITNFSLDDKAVFIPEKCGCERDLQEHVNTGNANDYLVVGDDIGSSHSYIAKHVEVNMNGGNDVIELDGAIDWYSRVNMGDGDDVIRSGAGSIKGDSIVNMGDGDDTITTEGGIYDRAIVNMGNGDDVLKVNCNLDYDAQVNTGEGNDSITIKGSMYGDSSLTTASGDDSVIINGCITNTADLNTGEGNDTIEVGGSVKYDSTIKTGEGQDTLIIGEHVGNNAAIDTGSGSDTISVGGGLWNNANINMGSDNDTFTLKGDAHGNSNVDLGTGNDTLVLSNPSCTIDLTNVANHFDDVETINISSQSSTKVTLNVSDIIDTTNDNNTIKIDGDSNDSVVNDKQWSWKSWSHENQDSWSYEGVESGYNKYIGTDNSGRTATLLVDTDIQTDF